MTRSVVSWVMLAALAAAGCSGDGSGGTTPTGPSPAPPVVNNPPPGTNPSCTPGAPGNLQAAVSGSTRTFTWSAVSNAADYFILVGTESGRSDLVNTNTTQTTYVWTGASPGRYYARVYARNSCGSSANSTEIIVN